MLPDQPWLAIPQPCHGAWGAEWTAGPGGLYPAAIRLGDGARGHWPSSISPQAAFGSFRVDSLVSAPPELSPQLEACSLEPEVTNHQCGQSEGRTHTGEALRLRWSTSVRLE